MLALHLRDPHQSGSWGFCPFNVLTGGYCPGCGGLRAVNDLTNLDLAAAASSNLLFVAALPLLAYLWVRWLRRSWDGSPPRAVPSPAVVVLVVVVTAFTIVRNLEIGAWLAP